MFYPPPLTRILSSQQQEGWNKEFVLCHAPYGHHPNIVDTAVVSYMNLGVAEPIAVSTSHIKYNRGATASLCSIIPPVWCGKKKSTGCVFSTGRFSTLVYLTTPTYPHYNQTNILAENREGAAATEETRRPYFFFSSLFLFFRVF